MKVKIVLLLLAVTAGLFAYTRPHNAAPPNLRDAVADSPLDTLKTEAGAEASGVSITKPTKPSSVPLGAGREPFNKGYIADNGPFAGAPTKPIEWVPISGGKFVMGTDCGEVGFTDAMPIHEVAIETFDMSKTDVTVEQYRECVIMSECSEPDTGEYCNWGVPGRQLHPVNCVDWDQASIYAKFKSKQPGYEGARLPSEAEWEYAARSGGKDNKYPWGNGKPTCIRAVTFGNGSFGCGKNSTMPVCSKTAGNTKQGLCDMAGNVWQWVQDTYQNSYEGAPADGRAFEGAGPNRVLRGGSFSYVGAGKLRTDRRSYADFGDPDSAFGFRLARSGR